MEQLTVRAGSERPPGIGASEAAAVAGLDPWRTAKELWALKLGLVPEPETTPDMERGNELEPFAIRAFEKKTGLKVEHSVINGGQVRYHHPEHHWLYAHPDGEVVVEGVRGLVEVKCPRIWNYNRAKLAGLLDYYVVQGQHQLMCSGISHIIYVLWHTDEWADPQIIEADADPELQKNLLALETEFWRRVQTGEWPDDTPALEVCAQERPDGMRFDMSEEWARLVDRLYQADAVRQHSKDALKMAEDYHREQGEHVKNYFGEHGGHGTIEGADARVHYKPQKAGTKINHEAFGREYPRLAKRIAERFTETTPGGIYFRTFWLGEKKKEMERDQ